MNNLYGPHSRKVLALSVMLGISIPCHIARAGNWSGGGGEILEYAQNPWFLDGPQESPPVKYCVMAAADFPVPLSVLENLVDSSIHWWDNQFSNAFYPDNMISINSNKTNLKVIVNTSRFIKEPCGQETDLSFQFGILSQEQANEFEKLQVDLTRFTAITIRTDYTDLLRGKGFIYVSPDRGPNAFRGQNVRKDAWTDHDLQFYRLHSVLTHELGHVFGLGHAPTNDSIMSAKLAELMVSIPSETSNEYLLAGLSSSVFFPKTGELKGDFCGQEQAIKAFRAYVEIPETMDCFRVRLSLDALIVEASENKDSMQWHRIGSAKFFDGGDRRHQQLVTLWLPNTQKFFPGLPAYIQSLLGPASSEVQQSASFAFANSSRAKPIFVQASPRFIQVGGVVDNKIVPDLLPVSAYGRAISGWSSR